MSSTVKVREKTKGANKAEDQLLQSEQRYRSLFEQIHEGMLLSDINGTILFVNPQFCKLTGYSEKELIGRNGYELLLEPEEAEMAQAKAGEREQGKYEQYELHFINKDGSKKWVKISASPNRDSDGKFIGVMSLVQDITEQRRNEVRQEVLYNIAQAASKTDANFDTVAKTVQKEISKVLNAINMYIAIYDEKKDIINFPYISDTALDKRLKVKAFNSRKPGKGLTELVLQSNKPLLINRSKIVDKKKNYETDYGKVPESWLGVPLTSDGRTIGVLAVQSYDSSNLYTEEDQAFLQFVSSQFASVLNKQLMQEALRESEKSFRSIAENSPSVVTKIDKTGKILYANKTFSKETSVDDVMGKTVYDFIVGSGKKIAKEKITYVFKEKKPSYYEVHIQLLNGDLIWIGTTAGPIFDDKGNVENVLLMALDITNKKEAEQALINSEIQNKAIIDSMPDIMFRMDAKGTYLDFKVEDESRLIVDPKSLVGKTKHDILPKKTADALVRKIKETIKTDEVQTVEYSLDEKAGVRHYEARFAKISDTEVLQIVRDITEEKEAQQALILEEEKYRTLIETLNEGIVKLDIDYSIVYTNKQFTQMCGYTEKELIGKNIIDLLVENDEEREQLRSGLQVQSDTVTGSVEFEMNHKSGKKIWMSSNNTALSDSQGKVIGLICALTDITDKKDREKEVFNALLTGQEKERQRIAQDLHDGLGQLLSGLKLHVRTRLPKEDPVAMQLIKIADDAISEYRLVSHNLIPPALTENGLSEALSNMCVGLNNASHIDIIYQQLGNYERVSIQEELELFRLCQELINNAIKHANPENVIVVLNCRNENITLSVEDDGKGFDATKINSSAGIGFKNMKTRAKMLNGELSVRSEINEGTKIKLQLN